MKARRTLPLIALVAAIACEPAGRDERGVDAPTHHEATAPVASVSAGGAAQLRISPEMLRDLRVTTSPVEVRPSGEGVTALGELHVNESAYAEVGSPIPARAAAVLVGLGDAVVATQPLAELQSVELGKARAEYVAAKARAEFARQVLERKRRLGGERIAPQREVQEAEAEAVTTAAALRAAYATLQALGVSAADVDDATDASRFLLRAPIAGTVIERSVVQGQAVDPARLLFRIADLSRLWLIARVYERDAIRLAAGAPARVTFPALPGRTFMATVALVGQQVDAESRTIAVRIEVSNDDGLLRPGMSATAWMCLAGADAAVLAVPAAALQRTPDGWCVFIPHGEGAFEIRPVGRGRDLGGEVEILNGLQAEEPVVVEGAFLLKAEADKARGAGEQHAH